MTRSGEGVVLEIRPEPTPDERAALLQALTAAGLLDGGAEPGAWWAEGLREALDVRHLAQASRRLSAKDATAGG